MKPSQRISDGVRSRPRADGFGSGGGMLASRISSIGPPPLGAPAGRGMLGWPIEQKSFLPVRHIRERHRRKRLSEGDDVENPALASGQGGVFQ
jgi:hypothetical protein